MFFLSFGWWVFELACLLNSVQAAVGDKNYSLKGSCVCFFPFFHPALIIFVFCQMGFWSHGVSGCTLWVAEKFSFLRIFFFFCFWKFHAFGLWVLPFIGFQVASNVICIKNWVLKGVFFFPCVLQYGFCISLLAKWCFVRRAGRKKKKKKN